MEEIVAIVALIEKLGFPIWAAVVLWGAIKFNKTVHDGLSDLRLRDVHLQKALEDHIARSDVRIALIEQLLHRHDDAISEVWQRIDGNGGRK